MIKWIFKWLFRLFLLAIVLVVAFFLSLDTILRVLVEHNIRAQTGMDAEIGRFHLGLAAPTITIQDLKIYNPAKSFDGTLFLDIPEIHVEYDRAALAKRELHFTLVRFNLGELDIVKNENGQTNIFSIAAAPTVKKNSERNSKAEFERQTGLKFTDIDALNVSVGLVKYIDLKDQRNNHEQTIGIENFVTKNVKSQDDLAILGFLVAVRGGDFFSSLIDTRNSGTGFPALFRNIMEFTGSAF